MGAKAIVVALVALAAFTGCATSGHRTVASNPNYRTDVVVQPWPMMTPDSTCRGWYDATAGACDSMGQ